MSPGGLNVFFYYNKAYKQEKCWKYAMWNRIAMEIGVIIGNLLIKALQYPSNLLKLAQMFHFFNSLFI